MPGAKSGGAHSFGATTQSSDSSQGDCPTAIGVLPASGKPTLRTSIDRLDNRMPKALFVPRWAQQSPHESER
jgi:hypothetical protein